jgi:hypothetical protein
MAPETARTTGPQLLKKTNTTQASQTFVRLLPELRLASQMIPPM